MRAPPTTAGVTEEGEETRQMSSRSRYSVDVEIYVCVFLRVPTTCLFLLCWFAFCIVLAQAPIKEVTLSSELPSSMRTIRATNTASTHPIKERFFSIQNRELIEPRKKMQYVFDDVVVAVVLAVAVLVYKCETEGVRAGARVYMCVCVYGMH
jgi:hypothetical protein